MPKIQRACVAIGSFSGGGGNAGCWDVPSPDGLLNKGARLIATDVAKHGCLLCLQSGSSHEVRSLVEQFYTQYHFDKYGGSRAVANEVAQYLETILNLYRGN